MRDSGMDAGRVDAARDAMRDAEPDVYTPLDAAIEALPCGVLEQAWQQFVSANDGCGRDEDCVIFDRVLYGAGGVCDGGHALMATLNAGALDMAVRYFDRVNSTECAIEPYVGRYWDHWTWVNYDRGFRVNPRCEAGRCTADWPDCRLEDGGN